MLSGFALVSLGFGKSQMSVQKLVTVSLKHLRVWSRKIMYFFQVAMRDQ